MIKTLFSPKISILLCITYTLVTFDTIKIVHMKKLLVFLFCLSSFAGLRAQTTPSIQRIDPTNWWVGMKNQSLQLLVYGPGAGTLTYSIIYPGIQIKSTGKVENLNYAFLNISIAANTRAGTFNVIGKAGKTTLTKPYTLLARNKTAKSAGLSAADFVYLLMPDRFANGNPLNDKFDFMLDKQSDANNPILRHGGDMQGIENHIDYLKELGVTAVWPTPVIVNDESLKLEGPGRMQAGYHGYHFTDHYQVDPRFGGNDGYKKLSASLHKNNIKLVQDAVYNHVSDDHWMFKDQPTSDWFNNWPQTTITTHKEQVLEDPHGSAFDKEKFIGGWFTGFLPDLNHRNPFLATYLIQNAVWYTEMFTVDAWRIDTYKYNDQAFMNRCNQALITEFPNIFLYGETVANNALTLSYFVKNKVGFAFKSNLPGTCDFPLNYAMLDGLNQRYGWDDGVNRIYNTLAQDVVYTDPMKMITQLDNHDMDRYLSVIGEDVDKYKMGLTWLLTMRGIPSLYYGTEILMKNTKNPSDAEVRSNFPGGFAGDQQNKFTSAGRNTAEEAAFNFIKKLANYRKNASQLTTGKLMQFQPDNGTYVYFRYNDKGSVMVATNTNNQKVELNTARFAERLKGFSKANDVISGAIHSSLSTILLPPKTALVLELIK